jgi:beta-lactamase regulating signal transducer with metallopeptidase domain
MIVIQLGASAARLGAAYMRFALADSLVTVVTAAFIVVLWLWLFRNVPNRIFSLVQNGGILLVPFVAAAAELAEHAAIYRLLDMAHDSYGSAIDLVVALHATKSAFGIVRDLLTAGFGLVALVWIVWHRRRVPR